MAFLLCSIYLSGEQYIEIAELRIVAIQKRIHAGKEIDREVCLRESIKSALAKLGYIADNLPTGAILAVCEW